MIVFAYVLNGRGPEASENDLSSHVMYHVNEQINHYIEQTYVHAFNAGNDDFLLLITLDANAQSYMRVVVTATFHLAIILL